MTIKDLHSLKWEAKGYNMVGYFVFLFSGNKKMLIKSKVMKQPGMHSQYKRNHEIYLYGRTSY